MVEPSATSFSAIRRITSAGRSIKALVICSRLPQACAMVPNIAVNGAGLTATLNVSLEGSQGFTKSGTGNLVLTLNSDSTLSGPIAVNGGTLTVDYSPGNSNFTNVLPPTDVTLANGGSLAIIAGVAQQPSQSLNSLTIKPGASTVSGSVPVLLNQATVAPGSLITANLGPITRNVGGLLNFSMPNIAPTANNGIVMSTLSTNTAGTILGGWAVAYLQPYNTVTGPAGAVHKC